MRGNFLYKKLGRRIAELRRLLNFSQDRLALLSDIDRTYLIRIEKGDANPTIKVIHKIAMNFKISMSKLLRGI